MRLTAVRGLVVSQNELNRPEGSLSVADNAVVDYSGVLQSRRGFREYSQLLAAKPKQLFTYKSKILTHFNNVLAFDSSTPGTFTQFVGNYMELVPGLRMKGLEASGNFYFTTSEGIKVISSKTAADFSTTTIKTAGAVEASDLSGKLVQDVSGFIPAQSKVSYRLVYGYKDANGNTHPGAPSSRVILTNQAQDVKISEIFTANVLNYATIVDKDYFTFDTLDTGYFVWLKKVSTSTAPVTADTLNREAIEADISDPSVNTNEEVAAIIGNVIQSSVSGVTVEITLSEVQVTVTSPGDTADVGQGSLAPSTIVVTKIFDGSITSGTAAKAELSFTLPQEVDTSYYYQLYRTAVITADVSQTLSDIDPGDEHNFVFEYPVTAGDVLAGEITVEDNTPEAFRAQGANLYTNPITGETILQANARPPIAQDIASFRNSVFYANTKDYHTSVVSLLSVDDFTSDSTKFIVGRGDTAVEYTFKGVDQEVYVYVNKKSESVGNSYVTLNAANNDRAYYLWLDKGINNKVFSNAAISANTFTVTAHEFVNGELVRFQGNVPGGITAGVGYYIAYINANQFQVTATPFGSPVVLTPTSGTGTVTHAPVDPQVPNRIGVRIPLELYGDSLAESRQALVDSFLSIGDFVLTDLGSNIVSVKNADSGNADAPTESIIPGWTHSVITVGDGEDAMAREVLLSHSSSVGVAIDLTARSLVRVINKDLDSPITAQYISGPDDLPGKILFKAKTIVDENFYLATNDFFVTSEFSPELPLKVTLNSINSTTDVFTTGAAHGLFVGSEVYINDNPGSTSTEFGGTYKVLTVPSPTTFTVGDVGINQPGPLSGYVYTTGAASDNNETPNRVYFSKANQPEAVPALNYIDVGSKDKQVLRILSLRDTLFVLKEDGIFSITGSSTNSFSAKLQDSSAIVIAPDSAVVLNNLIYALTTQGVVTISDASVSIVSIDIEDLIKRFTTFNYDFRYTSFGVSYESDRAYLLWLPSSRTDTVATQCFRYSTITRTWTRWTKANTCGVVNFLGDDRMYLGVGTGRHYVEQERKNNTREDHSDRDFTRQLGELSVVENKLTLSSILDIEVGDALTQQQYLTTTKFNRFLKKLDNDSGPLYDDYFSKFNVGQGANLANSLLAVVSYLNTDTSLNGPFPMPSGSNVKESLQSDFNALVTALNLTTSGTIFKDYKLVTDLLTYEVEIESVVKTSNSVVVDRSTWFVEGDVQIYKAIKFEVEYAAQHFGKPEELKQISEGTVLFDQCTVSNASIGYASDRSLNFVDIAFKMDGNGSFGTYPWISVPWGGNSNERGQRTLVPQQKARCKYLHVRFKHSVARQQFKLLGVSLEPRSISSRAYR